MNRKQLNFLFIVIILLLGFYDTTHGQVVNIEKKRKGNKDGFSGVVNLGFNIAEHNKHIVKFLNLVDLQYKKAQHTWIFLNSINLMKVNSSELINHGFVHLRYNYTFRKADFLTLETFTQYQYNTIKHIERRFLLGSGMRYRIVENEKVSFYLATLGMYEYEKRSNEAKEVLETARLASYASISWDILDNVSLRHISYYQPSFKNFHNYRLSTETSVNVAITKMLSLKIAFALTNDSHPSEGVNRTFYNLKNALQFKF